MCTNAFTSTASTQIMSEQNKTKYTHPGVALALKIGGQNCHSFVFVTCFLYCHSIVFEYSNNTGIRLFSI